MKKLNKITTTLTITLLAGTFLTSCQNKVSHETLTSALEKNPDIIINSIKKNPVKYLEALQEASKSAQETIANQREADEILNIKRQIRDPLKPVLLPQDIFRGNANAPVTIVEYTDFQCPFCERGNKTVLNLLEKYPGQVKVIYKNLPLDFHPQAMTAAMYFEAIGRQNYDLALKFHDEVFNNQRKISGGEKLFNEIAKKIGVNLIKLNKDIKDPRITEKIQAHMDEAASFKFNGTPGFIINGVAVRGAYPIAHFEKIINFLKEDKKLVLNE